MIVRATRTALLLITVAACVAGCQKPETTNAQPALAAEPTPAPATDAVVPELAPAPAPVAATPELVPAPAATAAIPASAAAAGAVALAAQDTNWTGVVVEVTEFRRKGNTLTAKLRFRNQGGSGEQRPEVVWTETYLLDTGAGKKYEALKDENGAYIAGNRGGWKDRWYDTMLSGDTRTTWVKFPAPPAEVRAITLQLPNIPPFEDLAIQD